jgi:MFS family permease
VYENNTSVATAAADSNGNWATTGIALSNGGYSFSATVTDASGTLAIGNFCGPLFLGSLFDMIGRKAMIAGTFSISGLLLLITAYLFATGFLTPITQTVAWFSIFFFASAAASSAYLTASEIFPLETRALAIACFYALGTAIGGSTSPLLFGWLIESGSAWRVSAGYVLAAALLLVAAGAELLLGIDAEGKSLESIADPLSS